MKDQVPQSQAAYQRGWLLTPPLLRLGGVGILEFWVFARDQNKIFLILREGEVSYDRGSIFCRGRSVLHSLFSIHFLILKCKIQKLKNVLPAAPSFSIFTFSDLRKMQSFKQIFTLTLTLNFIFQAAVPFHSPVGTQNKPNTWNCFIFWSCGGFRGPSKPSSQYSQSILCECKQTWQLLAKIKSIPFVNKLLYNSKECFEKESTKLSLTHKPLHSTTFHENLY